MSNDWTVKAIDISEHEKPGTLPCCPLCDNELCDWEDGAIVVAHGSMALAHASCVAELFVEVADE